MHVLQHSRELQLSQSISYRMRAKSTEKIPNWPSERCLEVEERAPAADAATASLASILGIIVKDAASNGVLEGVDIDDVSGKWRLRLAATVSGLQWRKSRPVPQSLVEEEEVGDVRGETAAESSFSSSSDASGLGVAMPLA